MHRFVERVLESVGGRKRGEIRQHDLVQANIVQHGLEYQGTLFQLRRRKDDHANHGQPTIAEQTGKGQHHGDGSADGHGAAGGGGKVDRT